MNNLSTLTLNACQLLMEGSIAPIDFAGLRVAFDSAPVEDANRKKAMLLTFAAQSSAPGAVAALREHGLIIPYGGAPEGRLSHSALRHVHKANVDEVIAILSEDLAALRAEPTTYARTAYALWSWQQIDTPIRNALVALGVRAKDTVSGDEPRFIFVRRLFPNSAARRAAQALLAT